jgi:Predicted ATP-dependent Lon-type protease
MAVMMIKASLSVKERLFFTAPTISGKIEQRIWRRSFAKDFLRSLFHFLIIESGRFSRGNTVGLAEAGFVMMRNTTVGENRMPFHKQDGIFSETPRFLQETAFIDRIHGLLPGWELHRVTKDMPSNFLGFKGDFFSEILHSFRNDTCFVDFVTDEMRLKNCNDLRDRKAITRLATRFLKILFPDINPTKEEFIDYCVKPAVDLRQRIRDELHKRDPEYSSVVIQS